MSFSLGNIGSIVSPLTNPLQTFQNAFGAVVPRRPDAPNLPQAPTLTAPTLPQYPGLSPEEQQLIQQGQGNLNAYQGAINNFNQNPYLQQSNQAGQTELTNYQNALQGRIAPNQALSLQKQKDWEALIQQAGQLGIQLSGNTPESAASQSTAGNQMIRDFNTRYGILEQNYNLGQQQFGQQANMQRLGLNNQTLSGQGSAYANLQNLNTTLQQPYSQQRLGQFGVQTGQAQSNADIANQNAMNAYQQATGQSLTNYNNALAGYNANMGLLQSGLGLAGQLGGAAMARGPSSLPTAQTTPMGMNPNGGGGSYIQSPTPVMGYGRSPIAPPNYWQTGGR